MKLLALESSAKAASCAVLEDAAQVAAAWQCTGLTPSRTLLPIVEDLLKNSGLALEDMDAIAARALELAAQAALRDAIGRLSAAEVAIRREQLDRELKRVLEEKTAPWGVTVLSVEVRDILLPRELQEVMSLEAQAEQRKKARIILMEAEQDVFETLAEMEDLVGGPEAVWRLRTMHLLNESLREGKGTVVIPSAFAEGFNEGLGDLLKG